jgi:hypothetical protein
MPEKGNVKVHYQEEDGITYWQVDSFAFIIVSNLKPYQKG